MWRFLVRSSVALSLGMACFSHQLLACGSPDRWFSNPNSIITDDAQLLSAPEASFWRELEEYMPARPPSPFPVIQSGQDPQTDTVEADLNELAEALESNGKSEEQINEIMEHYVELRGQLGRLSDRIVVEWDAVSEEYQVREKPEPLWNLPPAIPAEFAGYFRGAIAYHMGRLDEARQQWRQVLELPPSKRQYRSVWAAYMLGRSWVEDNPSQAVAWFNRTRQLARQGYRDSTGLAAASIGWEARAEMKRKHFREAVNLYLVQVNTEKYSAIESLRIVAAELIGSDDTTLTAMAKDEMLRALVMAYLVSYPGRFDDNQVQQVLAIMEKQVKPSTPGADRMAWIAYQNGDMETASRWVTLARQYSPVAQWIQAKLLLREGEPGKAAAVLARLVRRLPVSNDVDDRNWEVQGVNNRLRGELATLRLSGGQYTEALRLLIESNYPLDAAYVAERVLTTDELVAFVDSEYPGETLDPNAPDQYQPALLQRGIETRPDSLQVLSEAQDAFKYRFLAARRLVRAGRFQEASRYLPTNLKTVLDELLTLKQRGYNTSFGLDERVDNLWTAAYITRWYGQVLMGTEIEPDWYGLGCQFSPTPYAERRTSQHKPDWITADAVESSRIAQSAVEHDLRFHYRYTAALLAWDAADLYPDLSDEAAAILNEAGKWLVKSDPQLAGQFREAAQARLAPAEMESEITATVEGMELIQDDAVTDGNRGESERSDLDLPAAEGSDDGD